MDRRSFVKNAATAAAAVIALGAGAAARGDGVVVNETWTDFGLRITNRGDAAFRTVAADGTGLGELAPGESMSVAWEAAGVCPVSYVAAG